MTTVRIKRVTDDRPFRRYEGTFYPAIPATDPPTVGLSRTDGTEGSSAFLKGSFFSFGSRSGYRSRYSGGSISGRSEDAGAAPAMVSRFVGSFPAEKGFADTWSTGSCW